MIGYPEALANIEAAIDDEAPKWPERAHERTRIFQQWGRYLEEWRDDAGERHALPPFWGDIKPIYIRLQHRKCVYCEKKLEGGSFATVEWDLEHFRPKGRLTSWRPPTPELHDSPMGEPSAIGYYLLAYHPGNYAAACKTCNSSLKRDRFPVAAERQLTAASPEECASEMPYLIYPLGGEDPMEVIRFHGVEARPRHSREEHADHWRRARVIIDFFELNREGLQRDRAEWLYRTVRSTLKHIEQGDTSEAENLEAFLSARSQFTACTRDFVELWQSDHAEAQVALDIARTILSQER